MSLPEEWIDYIFLEPTEDEPTIPIKILTGEYKDVILCFGVVKIHEDEAGGFARLSFNYKILNQDRKIKKRLMKDAKFKDYIGSILNSTVLGVMDADRESNSKILIEEPKLRTKGPTIPEE